jgi:hypothetical protein
MGIMRFISFLLLGGMLLLADASLISAQEREESGVGRIDFSGYSWEIKAARHAMGPGPNYFSRSAENVGVDDSGRLLLRVREQRGRWLCSEVIARGDFGYGTYLFRIASPLDRYDPQLVVGLFIWDDTVIPCHNEIDIEFSRWGGREDLPGQYVVQPVTEQDNLYRFDFISSSSTHLIHWHRDEVSFASYPGLVNPEGSEPAASWHYRGAVPVPGKETEVRINFWLYQGKDPAKGSDELLVVDSFEYFPAR